MVDVSEQEPLIRKARPEAPARRRLAVNYFFQLLNQLVRICGTRLVPLFLSARGPDIYKDWVVLYAIMIFLTSCNFGTETYFGNRFIEFVARNDRAAFRRELMTSLFCTLAVGALVLAASYAPPFGYSSGRAKFLFGLSRPQRSTVRLLLMTLPVAFIFAQQTLLTI